MFPDRDGDGEPDLPEGFSLPDMEGEPFDQVGTGSGVIMDVDGSTAYVLTNNHVAGNADELTITLSDGRQIKDAKVVGKDPKTDLAVIKINADRLIGSKWGDSSTLQKGDWIMAFGSPFGYIGSMTHGIVSALNRDVGILRSSSGLAYENFIQVDAPINPGNSGGPLVNVKGEVVGINTAIASTRGGFMGIGFAIPSNQAKVVYEQLKNTGKVTRGWLGVSIANVTDPADAASVKSFGWDKTNGVFVREVFEKTPAFDKLQAGDVVVTLNGDELRNVQEFRNKVALLAPKTEITLGVFREKKMQDVKLSVGEQPEQFVAGSRRPGSNEDSEPESDEVEKKSDFGMTLGDLSDQVRERFNIAESVKGALVREVEPRSAAAKEGIRPGDVITKVFTTSVTNAKEAREALSNADSSKGVRLYVVGRGASRFVFLPPVEKK
jgi:serine protease Do